MANRPGLPHHDELTQCELDRVLAETFVESIDYHWQHESTNDRALQLARQAAGLDAATLVFAERQTAGRGRGENQWWSGEGALTFSLLLSNEKLLLPPTNLPQTSLVAGLAVATAIEQFFRDETVQLKWPNDVFLRGCKVCGILVEAINGSNGALVIGIGLNANNSVANAPAELRDNAIALCDLAGRDLGRNHLLIITLQHLEWQLGKLRAGDNQLQQQWQRRCMLNGRSVKLDTPTGPLAGECRGIDSHGALLLETKTGLQRCLAGTVSKVD